MEQYSNLLSHLPVSPSNITSAPSFTPSLIFDGANLAMCAMVDGVGFCGGTVSIIRNIPQSDYFILGVVTSPNHIVDYTKGEMRHFQIWNNLGMLSGYEVPTFTDIIVYPYRESDKNPVVIATSNSECVRIFVILLPDQNKSSNGAFQKLEASRILRVSMMDAHIEHCRIAWAMYDDTSHLLSGTSNGYIIEWSVSGSSEIVLPDKKIRAHPMYSITAIAVNPNEQNLVCTVATNFQSMIWDLRKPNCPLSIIVRRAKQILLTHELHWYLNWRCIHHLTLFPRSRTSMNLFSNIILPDEPMMSECSFYSDEIHKEVLSCFSVSDKFSGFASGFRTGTAVVCNFYKPYHTCPRIGNKTHNVKFVKCTANVSTDSNYSPISQNSENGETRKKSDMEYLQKFRYSVEFSKNKITTTSFQTSPMYKNIISVTAICWSSYDFKGDKVCIGFQNGLFKILDVSSEDHFSER